MRVRSVDVIIPNWNGNDLIAHCLKSLQNLEYSNFKVVVVDNGSTDNSVNTIKNEFKWVELIELKYNSGFVMAVNLAIKNSKAEMVALLNNDTEVDSMWLNHLVESFELDPSIGIVTSKLINFYNRKIIDSAGDSTNIVGQCKSRGIGLPISDYTTTEFVFGATGGASIYKKELFEKIGLFDEIYYMYFEDADFSYRAQKVGFKVLYQPQAIVYHIHKASSKKRGAFIEFLLYRNFMIFYLINTPTSLFWKRNSLIKFILVVFNTFYFLSKNGLFIQALKCWLWIVSNILVLHRKRFQRNVKNINLDYLDSLRVDKKIKIFGIIW